MDNVDVSLAVVAEVAVPLFLDLREGGAGGGGGVLLVSLCSLDFFLPKIRLMLCINVCTRI